MTDLGIRCLLRKSASCGIDPQEDQGNLQIATNRIELEETEKLRMMNPLFIAVMVFVSVFGAAVLANLYHHHHVTYHLLEYTVMPNHVHVMFIPIDADASSVGHVASASSVREVLSNFCHEDAGSVRHAAQKSQAARTPIPLNQPSPWPCWPCRLANK